MLLTKRIVQLIALKDTLLSFLKYANQGFSWYSYEGERLYLVGGLFLGDHQRSIIHFLRTLLRMVSHIYGAYMQSKILIT